MYNQNYEEYLRSVLGYGNGSDIYNTYSNPYIYQEPNCFRNSGNMMIQENLEDEYPEIYKVIYPMVLKICQRNGNRQITRQLLDDMTDEIYENVEPTMTEVNINVQVKGEDKNISNKTGDKKEVRETRQRRNPLLRDLIRILILRELGIGAPTFRPRPPFPGGPGMPGRPPMGPRPMPYGF